MEKSFLMGETVNHPIFGTLTSYGTMKEYRKSFDNMWVDAYKAGYRGETTHHFNFLKKYRSDVEFFKMVYELDEDYNVYHVKHPKNKLTSVVRGIFHYPELVKFLLLEKDGKYYQTIVGARDMYSLYYYVVPLDEKGKLMFWGKKHEGLYSITMFKMGYINEVMGGLSEIARKEMGVTLEEWEATKK